MNDVVPLLTKSGCNTGVCHAKAGTGQNGLQFSLLGFEPREDYEHLVKRRTRPSPISTCAGREPAAYQSDRQGSAWRWSSIRGWVARYETLLQWIRQGAIYDGESAPKLTAFTVQPSEGAVSPQDVQQLKAIAHYSDGSQRDVTEMALYEANDPAMIEVNDRGSVKFLDLPAKLL